MLVLSCSRWGLKACIAERYSANISPTKAIASRPGIPNLGEVEKLAARLIAIILLSAERFTLRLATYSGSQFVMVQMVIKIDACPKRDSLQLLSLVETRFIASSCPGGARQQKMYRTDMRNAIIGNSIRSVPIAQIYRQDLAQGCLFFYSSCLNPLLASHNIFACVGMLPLNETPNG